MTVYVHSVGENRRQKKAAEVKNGGLVQLFSGFGFPSAAAE